jgi:hypothetical protein
MRTGEGRTGSGAGWPHEPPPAWEPRAVARARGLAELLRRRPELTGVYPPADVTADAVRWSA